MCTVNRGDTIFCDHHFNYTIQDEITIYNEWYQNNQITDSAYARDSLYDKITTHYGAKCERKILANILGFITILYINL